MYDQLAQKCNLKIHDEL